MDLLSEVPADNRLPWEVCPSFRPERLIEIGGMVWGAHVSAAEHAQPDLGDRRVVVAFTAYNRTTWAIERAVTGPLASWLSVEPGDKYFKVKFNLAPIRVYSGDPDITVPERVGDPAERAALEVAYGLFGQIPPECFFRLIVEHDAKYFPTRISWAQMTMGGTPYNFWEIPINGTGTLTIDDTRPDPVVPPLPAVGDEEEESRKEQEKKDHKNRKPKKGA